MGLVAGGLTAAGVIWRFFFKRVVSPVVQKRRARAHAKLAGAIAEELNARLTAMLDPIKSELQHNGGGSIKDAVKRIESSLELTMSRQIDIRQVMTDGFAAVNAQLEAGRSQFSAVDQRLKVIESRPTVETKVHINTDS